jgi:hypothetical protein
VVEALPDTKINRPNNKEGEEEKKQGSDEDSKCLVCYCDYEEGETVKTLPCFHKYHKQCIEEWFKVQNFCPFCRHEVK